MTRPDVALLAEALRSELERAALGSLLTTAVHGGNNRLTVILTALDLLRDPRASPEDVQAALGLAAGAARQLADEFGLLLAGARRATEPAVPLDLAEAVQSACRLDALLHDGPLDLQLDLAQDLTVETARARFEATLLQVFVLARRRGASAVRLRSYGLEVAARTAERPALRKGRYSVLEFRLPGVTLPETLQRGGADPVAALGRLSHADGPQVAAVEAYVAALRGQLVVRDEADGTALELYLPVTQPAA
jgi:hypothetical protein